MGIAFVGNDWKMVSSHTSMTKLRNGAANNSLIGIIGLQNSPNLNPLDYCLWDELDKKIKWNRVTSRKSR